MTPEEIVDQPIILLDGSIIDSSGQASSPLTQSPTTELDKKFPPRIVAHATISESLDTETKRIKGEFQFESLGAFTVQSTIHPLASITYSGDGIIGIDANGNTTFSIDGETGDATFLGTLQAGTLIGGDNTVIIGIGGAGGGRIVLYNSGI